MTEGAREVQGEHEQVFAELRGAIAGIREEPLRTELIARANAMEESVTRPEFIDRLQEFFTTGARVAATFAPLIPRLLERAHTLPTP